MEEDPREDEHDEGAVLTLLKACLEILQRDNPDGKRFADVLTDEAFEALVEGLGRPPTETE